MGEVVPASRRQTEGREREIGEAVGPAIDVAVHGTSVGHRSPNRTNSASPLDGLRVKHHQTRRPLATEGKGSPPRGPLVGARSGLESRTDAIRRAIDQE